MKIRKTTPTRLNKYYLKQGYGGYNPCVLGNKNNRPYKGSVLANCVGMSVGRLNEIHGEKNCNLIGNLYPRAMKEKAIKQGLEVGTEPRPGCLLLWYGTNGKEHVASVEAVDAKGCWIIESGWNFPKKTYTKYRYVTKAKNYGRSSLYKYRGCIYSPDIELYPNPTDKVIRPGEKGEKVKWMQWAICKAGYKIAIDGSFGPATEAALKKAQKVWKLTADGICGPKTQAKIKSLYTLQ